MVAGLFCCVFVGMVHGFTHPCIPNTLEEPAGYGWAVGNDWSCQQRLPLRADLDGDANVTLTDLAVLASRWIMGV